jgi:hypothetical protein
LRELFFFAEMHYTQSREGSRKALSEARTPSPVGSNLTPA